MTNTGRNALIIGFISTGLVIYAVRVKPLFKSKSKDNPTAPPATSDDNAVSDKQNAKTAADALRIAVASDAPTEDLQQLKTDVYNDYGLSMSMDGQNNVIVKSRSGNTILNEPLGA